ncbi:MULTISPECIES: hypothetical protein [unclassified Arenibacter]|jgi:hypothetical protein|uniref:hypothetical protein n=1 Tax=unclassified Arenibacter TaxID=2615047 RepID=UPI000E34063C|nr:MULTISPECIES: hypothetical protein [unclassified Arenibacter]MCM4165217.1 hypothetical protein [Arenibacter sp. A80]RFT55075.1 hypothetical protein D0S24_16585 [Arenibacter sp. P308M17]
MTDELELLKRDWQNKDKQLPQLSFNEIYKMIWKKSSSIVKWIFIISIIEFAVPHLLYLLPVMSKSMAVWRGLGLGNFLLLSNIVHYSVVLFFIYQFYRRYKEISTLDNAKQLLSNILKTRKTVKHYVIFCLSLIFISYLVMAVGIYLSDDPIAAMGYNYTTENIDPEKLKATIIVTLVVLGFVVTLLMGCIYFLLYGILLKKLNKNYKELKEMDI